MQPTRNVFRADRASYRRLEEKEAAAGGGRRLVEEEEEEDEGGGERECGKGLKWHG